MYLDLEKLCHTQLGLSSFNYCSKFCLFPSSSYHLLESSTSSFGYSNSWFRSKPAFGSWPISDLLLSNPIYAYRLDLFVDFSTGILYHKNIPVIQSYGDNELFSIVYSSIQQPSTPCSSLPDVQYPVFVSSSRWAQSNYWHWLLDLLPQLLLYIDSGLFEKVPYIHIPPNLSLKFQLEWLSPLFTLARNLSVQFSTAPRTSVFYKDAIYIPSLCLPRPTPFLPDLLRQYARRFFPESSQSNTRLNLFLLRKPNTQRSATNTQELLAWSRLNDFMPVFLEDYSVAEQIKLFRSAQVVIGMHGAGLANIVFMQPGSNLLELTPSTGYNPAIQDLASASSLIYGIIPFKCADLRQQYSVNLALLDAYLSML